MKKQKISILTPVFNEQDNIKYFYSRTLKTLKVLKNKYEYEIIFTDNFSTDKTCEEISKIIKEDKNVKLITLSRNFGRNNSQLAGLENSTGDIIFMIDVDCEDPPEMLIEFLEIYEQGYQHVYGIRNRIKESLFLYLGAKVFYRVTKLLADEELVLDMAEFSLFSSDVKDEILKTNSSYPFIRAELSAVGFKKHGISYKRTKRKNGESKYNLVRLAKFAVAGFLTSSSFILRANAFLGFLMLTINSFFLVKYLLHKNLNLDILILINLIIFMFSISSISLYVGRIHTNSLSRPKYIIDFSRSINFKKTK